MVERSRSNFRGRSPIRTRKSQSRTPIQGELEQEIAQGQQAQTNLTQIFYLSLPDDPWSFPLN